MPYTPLTPVYERKNVLTGQAQMYMKPADPLVAAVIPADTVALGAAWPNDWRPVGATMDGLNFQFQRSKQAIRIEEQPNEIDSRTKDLKFQMQVDFSEDTLQTMRIAYGGGNIVSATATSNTYGYSQLVISDEMEDYAFGFEGMNQFGLARRCVIPIVKSVGNIKTEYRRANKQRIYSVNLESVVPLSQCPIRDINALPTS